MLHQREIKTLQRLLGNQQYDSYGWNTAFTATNPIDILKETEITS